MTKGTLNRSIYNKAVIFKGYNSNTYMIMYSVDFYSSDDLIISKEFTHKEDAIQMARLWITPEIPSRAH